MAGFAVTFTGADGDLVSAYVGDDGTTFSSHPNYTGIYKILNNHATTPSGGPQALWYAEWVPASADYSVSGGMYIASTQVSRSGPAFRIDLTSKSFYYTRFRASLLELVQVVNGTQSTIGTAPYSLVGLTGTTRPVVISGVGSLITVSIDGAVAFTATGTGPAGAGRAGMYWDNGVVGDGTGQAFDDLSAADAAGGGLASISGTAGLSFSMTVVADGLARLAGMGGITLGAPTVLGVGAVPAGAGGVYTMGAIQVQAMGGVAVGAAGGYTLPEVIVLGRDNKGERIPHGNRLSIGLGIGI